MAYQEVTSTSYGKRIGNSFRGIGAGILMIVAGTVLLWWNEGRAVKTTKGLNELGSVAVHVQDVSVIDAAMDGRVIHASALATTEDVLHDPQFNVSANAIKLAREVEYYQWTESSTTETRDKVGGSQETVTTYDYSKGWTSEPVNSSGFHDPAYKEKNSVIYKADDCEIVSEHVTFGAYRLPSGMVESICASVPADVNYTEEEIAWWNESIKRTLGVASVKDSAGVYEYVHVNGNVIYIGKNAGNPEVGDVRITFSKVLPQDISIIAQVQGDTFVPYQAGSGKAFSIVNQGVVGLDRMMERQHESNRMMLWILRIVGILVVIGGFKGILGILDTLAKVLPFLSKIIGAGTGLVSSVLGSVWSVLVVAVAWIAYRPVIGVSLLAIAVALAAFLIYKGKRMR